MMRNFVQDPRVSVLHQTWAPECKTKILQHTERSYERTLDNRLHVAVDDDTNKHTRPHTHTQSASLTSWIIWTAYISPAPDLNGTWVIFAFGQIVQDEWIDTCDTENMSRPAVTDWLTWAMWLKGVCAYGESRWRGGGPVAEVTDLRKEKT